VSAWTILRGRLRWLLTILLSLALIRAVGAHDPQLSGLRVLVSPGTTVVSVTTHLSRLAAAEGTANGALDPSAADRAIRRRLRLRFAGKDFPPARAHVLYDARNDIVVWQTRLKEEAADPEVLARLYPEDPTSRLVVTVVRDGQVAQETLLDSGYPALLLAHAATADDWRSVALRYGREGVRHIFGGPDHLCFLLGLLLLGGSLSTLLRMVTAFTLAHSITLSLAATDILSASPRLVEPLIALSIVVIAAENLRAQDATTAITPTPVRRDHRPWLAFAFGLIHGLGFAGALAEVGLPPTALGISLASFNVGVELGQAAIVLVAVPLLNVLASRHARMHRRAVWLGSLGIGLAGIYWLIARLA
jgi:hypothetical protein